MTPRLTPLLLLALALGCPPGSAGDDDASPADDDLGDDDAGDDDAGDDDAGDDDTGDDDGGDDDTGPTSATCGPYDLEAGAYFTLVVHGTSFADAACLFHRDWVPTSAPDAAYVRFLHLAPDLGPVDFYRNMENPPGFAGVPYGTSAPDPVDGGYADYVSGDGAWWAVYPEGETPQTGTAYIGTYLEALPDGGWITFALDTNPQGTHGLLRFFKAPEIALPGPDRAALIFLHTMTDVGSVAVTIQPGGEHFVEHESQGSNSDYREVASGTWSFEVTEVP